MRRYSAGSARDVSRRLPVKFRCNHGMARHGSPQPITLPQMNVSRILRSQWPSPSPDDVIVGHAGGALLHGVGHALRLLAAHRKIRPGRRSEYSHPTLAVSSGAQRCMTRRIHPRKARPRTSWAWRLLSSSLRSSSRPMVVSLLHDRPPWLAGPGPWRDGAGSRLSRRDLLWTKGHWQCVRRYSKRHILRCERSPRHWRKIR